VSRNRYLATLISETFLLFCSLPFPKVSTPTC
jgi:hypothetical protein